MCLVFRICRVRSLLMEIVDPSKQPLWTLGGYWISDIKLQNLLNLNICRCLFSLCQWWRLCLWEEKWIFYQHPKSRRWCNWVISAEEAGDIVYNISGCSEMFVWRWPFTWGNTGSEGFSTFSFHTHLQIISASVHVSIKQDFHQANKYFFPGIDTYVQMQMQ